LNRGLEAIAPRVGARVDGAPRAARSTVTSIVLGVADLMAIQTDARS